MYRREYVDIVMACYNGEAHVRDQLQSIIDQMRLGDKLLIHDDGSQDSTKRITEEIQKKYSDLVFLIDAPSKGGASQNFSFLLSQTTSKYVLCSDQDDLWLLGKLDLLYSQMCKCEADFGAKVPILIHSDLHLIDAEGREISKSFWKFQNINPEWGNYFPRILTQNVVTGCTVMVNRALLDIALPVPNDAVMHDWWLALVACAYGRVVYLPVPTVAYRQHGGNEVGAKNFNLNYIVKRTKELYENRDSEGKLYHGAAQAKIFAERYSTIDEARIANVFASLPHLNIFRKFFLKVKFGFKKVGLVRNIGWLFT